MECRLSAPSTLIIYPLPSVTVSEQPFAVSRNRDGLKCDVRFWSHAGSGARNLTDHEALHHLQRVARRYPSADGFLCGFSLWVRDENHVTLLERVVISGISGAAVGGMAGNPLAGAAGGVFNQVAGVIGNDVPEFRLIFRSGTFNLARRLNRDLRNIRRMPELLGSILRLTRMGLWADLGDCRSSTDPFPRCSHSCQPVRSSRSSYASPAFRRVLVSGSGISLGWFPQEFHQNLRHATAGRCVACSH